MKTQTTINTLNALPYAKLLNDVDGKFVRYYTLECVRSISAGICSLEAYEEEGASDDEVAREINEGELGDDFLFVLETICKIENQEKCTPSDLHRLECFKKIMDSFQDVLYFHESDFLIDA